MSRASSPFALAGAVWIAALVAVIVAALAAGWPVAAHGYFAGWLVAVSLPLGALPVLMALDLAGGTETPAKSALRLLLAALPILALLLVPVLLDLRGVFPWPPGSTLAPASAEPPKGFAVSWYQPAAFGLRSVLYLVVWVVLSLFFVRPAPPSSRHRTIAGVGLALHLVVGTLAAFDWWMSLDQGFNASAYGLLVMTTQATFAMALASLIALASGRSDTMERPMLSALLAMLFLAAFLQFSQYLAIWSANLPREIVWYQTRWVGALGPVFVIAIPVLLAFAFAVLIPPSLAARRLPAIAALCAILLLAFLDLVCLASPRGTFTFGNVALAIAFIILIGGLGACCAAVLGGRLARGMRHG